MSRPTVVLSTRESEYFAQRIANRLLLPFIPTERKTFGGGERYYRIDVKDAFDLVSHNVIYVASLHSDEAFLEMLKVCDTLVGAAKIGKLVVVVPFLGYSTMDRRKHPIEVVSAKVNAKIISRMLHRSNDFILTLDLHTEGLANYFEGLHDVDPLSALPVLTEGIKELGLPLDKLAVASVDLGRPKAIKLVAKAFGAPLALIDKERDFEDVTAGQVIGNVRGRPVLMCDDILRSGDSGIEAGNEYLRQEAESVDLAVTHLALNGEFIVDVLERSAIRRIVATNSHPMSQHMRVQTSEKFLIKDVSGVFETPIRKILALEI